MIYTMGKSPMSSKDFRVGGTSHIPYAGTILGGSIRSMPFFKSLTTD